jgi:hypothetical protein
VAVLVAVRFCDAHNGCFEFRSVALNCRQAHSPMPERSRARPGVKAALTRRCTVKSLDTGSLSLGKLSLSSGECPQLKCYHFEADAIRSTTDSLCSGDRWLYRADIMIDLWPAAS